MRRGLVAAVLAAGLLAGLAAGPARADGDPASDYLIGQKVFLPFDAKIPQVEQQKLIAAVQSATKLGFPIRVALIWSDYDLGSVTALWKKPQIYARFLGIELSYYFHGRLLIVMPSGFGLYYAKHAVAKEKALLATIPIGGTPAALARAARTAVVRLAAASGVTVGTPVKVTTPAQRNAHDRIVIVLSVLLALAVGALLRILIRRRAASRVTG
jgi:hypothetical protein